jgi:hypothetical protein
MYTTAQYAMAVESSVQFPILFLLDPFQYNPASYAFVSQVATFYEYDLQVCDDSILIYHNSGH